MFLFPELIHLLCVAGLHGGFAGNPGGWADFTVLIGVFEGLDESDDLVDVAADGQIADADVSQHALVIDDVSGAEGDARVTAALDKAAVVLCDLVGDVGEERHVHWAKTTLLAVLLCVLHVGEVRVDRASDNLGVFSLKLGSLVRELANLGWADEGKVKGPEEEDDVLA